MSGQNKNELHDISMETMSTLKSTKICSNFDGVHGKLNRFMKRLDNFQFAWCWRLVRAGDRKIQHFYKKACTQEVVEMEGRPGWLEVVIWVDIRIVEKRCFLIGGYVFVYMCVWEPQSIRNRSEGARAKRKTQRKGRERERDCVRMEEVIRAPR